MAQGDHPGPEPRSASITRRDLLKTAGMLGVGAAAFRGSHLLSGGRTAIFDDAASRASSIWTGGHVTKPLGLDSSGTPKRGGNLKWAWEFEPVEQMTPQQPTSGDIGTIDTFLWIYTQLTNMRASKDGPPFPINGPGLAESWDISKNGLTYTFHLRDSEFSNGDKVTAADVVYSMQRFASPKVNGQYAFLSVITINSIKALNSKTVRIGLQRPQKMFLTVVGHGVSSIIPKRIHEKLGTKTFGKRPVGSGPFMFTKKVPSETLVLKRNPNYWKPGKPYLDSMTFTYVPGGSARMLHVTSGESNVAFTVPYELVEEYKDYPGTRLQMEPTTNVMYLAPNIRVKPYTTKYVRIALNYATPKETIIKVVFKGIPVVANSAIGTLRTYTPHVPSVPYDLAKAKEFLSKSSVPSGFTTNLLIVGTTVDSVSLASILVKAWGDLGVTLHIDEVTQTTMFTRFFSMTNPNYDINLFEADYSNSDVASSTEIAEFFYDPLAVKFGGYFYTTTTVNKKLDLALDSLTTALRKKTFATLQKYCLFTNPPIIPIGFGPARTLVSSNVRGLVTLSNDSWRGEDIWLA